MKAQTIHFARPVQPANDQGWSVAEVSTVAEGLGSLDPAPDWVVLDLMLPDGDGETVLKKIRNDHLPSRVAVCTGAGDPARLAGVVALGPDLILSKPIDIFALLGACAAVGRL